MAWLQRLDDVFNLIALPGFPDDILRTLQPPNLDELLENKMGRLHDLPHFARPQIVKKRKTFQPLYFLTGRSDPMLELFKLRERLQTYFRILLVKRFVCIRHRRFMILTLPA